MVSYLPNFNKMLLYLLLVAASPIFVTAFPQNSGDASTAQIDGFVFDGPVASRQPNEKQRISSTSTTAASTTAASTPLLNAQFDACVTSCPTTFEYNPVCGTDNTDYTNPGGLGCAKQCGKDVTVNYYGRCSTGTTG